MPDDPITYPLLDHALEHARSCHDDLTDPEEDILPVLLWVGPYGMGIMPMLEMGDGEQKDQLAAMMTSSLACSRAVQAVMITTSWMVAAPPPDSDEEKEARKGKGFVDIMGCMPSEHPDRMECVTAMHATLEDGKDSMSHAVVTRYPDKPPTLGEWQGRTETMQSKIGGRFGDAIHLGMKIATDMPPEMIEILDAGWRDGEQTDLISRFHKVMTGFTPEMHTETMGPKE
jgi:hypothetical protein